VFAPVRGKDRVVACSRAARRRGITVGMLHADAESLAGRGVRFEPHDRLADVQRLRELAVVAQQFSPAVALDPGEWPEALFLDATGCGVGHGGETAFAGLVVNAARRGGYWGFAATADTAGAAWAVARYGAGSQLFETEPRARVAVVPPDEQVEALGPLPVEALRLPPAAVEVLHALSVVRIEQLLALPREQLPARFGTELLACIDRATGAIPEGLRPERLDEPLEARWSFDPPVANSLVLLNVFDELLGRLLKEVGGQGVGFQKLLWWLKTGKRDQVCQPVELLRPTASRKDLVDLIRLQLERVKLPGEVTDVAVRATVVAPLVYRQGDLFGGRIGAQRPPDVTGLIERLSSRLGNAAVLRPRLVPDAQPELAFTYDPWLAAERPREQARSPLRMTRPARIKEHPEPVRVMSAPGGPPGWIQWEDREYAIERTWGPERVETGWWRGADVRRDYYVAETTDGERLWLFRDLAAGGWFVQGVFE
jgi:protein ImuB